TLRFGSCELCEFQISKFNGYIEKSAVQGYFGAVFQLGYCYVNGIGVEANKEKGFELYNKAAGNNDDILLIYCDDVIFSDLDEVNYWYHKAADNDNNQLALYKLGELYEIGKGVGENLTRAFEFYKSSANQGYSEALCKVGYYYEHGIIVEADKERAMDLYRLAAKEGNGMAQKYIANLFEQSEEIENNI
ncbi:4911_t:CDS:2, partial [Funneliformis geosporum]